MVIVSIVYLSIVVPVRLQRQVRPSYPPYPHNRCQPSHLTSPSLTHPSIFSATQVRAGAFGPPYRFMPASPSEAEALATRLWSPTLYVDYLVDLLLLVDMLLNLFAFSYAQVVTG